MEKITSFTIDHIKLQPGVYVSRKDPVGDQVITTFDIRMTSPKRGTGHEYSRTSCHGTSGSNFSP